MTSSGKKPKLVLFPHRHRGPRDIGRSSGRIICIGEALLGNRVVPDRQVT